MNRLAGHSGRKQMNGYAMSFLICAVTAFFIFLPFLIVDRGLFQYCGDFNSQQIPFYTYMNGFVKNSPGQWSWATDLGTSAVNAYSFYLLGSPFFWLTTLLPQAWVPFSMVPMFMLKFGVAGLGAYAYLARYAKSRNYAVIGACLYALSGFTVYNTFFNHFVDCVALFPFLLWALDNYVYDGQRAIFPLMVAVNVLNNYFFFAGQIVFLFLYFFIMLAVGEYKIRFKTFLQLAFESLLGVALGCLLLWPAVLCLADNPRTVNLSSGFGFLLYGRVQQYFAILSSLFLPPDPTYLPNIFKDAVIKHTSMTAYLPIVSCAGVWAYMKTRQKSGFTKLLWACLIMALVPVLNSSFYALNSSYYARWYYMPILIMCAATMCALQDEEIDLMTGFRPVMVITLLFAVFALVPEKTDETWSIGVVQNQAQFWLTYLTAVLGLLIFLSVIRQCYERPNFTRVLLAAILGFSVFYSVVHISLGKFPQWEGDANYRSQCYESARHMELPDDHFYRIDTYETQDNLGLWAEKPCIHFFNSVVTPSIMDFYPRVGVKRDVSSKPEQKLYALRGLLSVEYIAVEPDKADEFAEDWGAYGYTLDHSDGAITYFRNENYVPMGFTYDKYILLEEEETEDKAEEDAQDEEGADSTDAAAETPAPITLMGRPEESRSQLLMRAIALTPEQIEKYGHLMEPMQTTDLSTGYERYVQDVQARRRTAAHRFEADGTGFTAQITLPRENLVFFSVPFDEGFTAQVNGRPVEIERVNGGLSAVLCPAGENTIVFSYETPGLDLTKKITAGAAVVWAVYAGAVLYRKKKRA